MSERLGSKDLRDAFEEQPLKLVRLVPGGFRIEDRLHEELIGSIERIHLVRKRFENRSLVCASRDGVIAKDGTRCQDCLHPRCRPWLRVYLRGERYRYLLDLDQEAARLVFECEDIAEQAGACLAEWTLRLSVLDSNGYPKLQIGKH